MAASFPVSTVSASAESIVVSASFNRRSLHSRVGPGKATRFGQGSGRQPSGQPDCNLDWLWSSLLESLPQGVMVLSRGLQPVYCNQKAKECLRLLAAGSAELPTAISEVGHRLLRSGDKPIVLEHQVSRETLRVSARWLTAFQPSQECEARSAQLRDDRPAYILIFLENCTKALHQEVQIEQQKFDLTERETEVWRLLRQEYSYQEIAKLLQISLNTVKTHVKNVYAKKRSCMGREKFWCGE
ncbi:MAG TPA: LuxR C-terminal-related transcriptional regulator [Thermosynechococcaceae cyanobacterium]